MIKLKDLIMEIWNSDIWPSNIWNSNIWNSDIWPSKVWEGQQLNEIIGYHNYWVLPSGKIEEVDDHINWFTDNVDSEFFHDEDGFPTKEDGSICEPEEVYDAAYSMGYIRMTKEIKDDSPLMVDFSPQRLPSNIQWRNIRDFAIENGWQVYNAPLNKIIEL
jgi:hypothetical protein